FSSSSRSCSGPLEPNPLFHCGRMLECVQVRGSRRFVSQTACTSWGTILMQASIEQILSSYDDQAPLSEASTIPASWYIDPRIAELERLNAFSKTWQRVPRTEQVKDPGDFVTTRLAGEPIVGVRGTARTVR